MSLDDKEDRKGIIGDEKDLEWRKIKYGDNVPIEQKSKSFWILLFDNFRDDMLKVMFASSLLSIIVEYRENGL